MQFRHVLRYLSCLLLKDVFCQSCATVHYLQMQLPCGLAIKARLLQKDVAWFGHNTPLPGIQNVDLCHSVQISIFHLSIASVHPEPTEEFRPMFVWILLSQILDEAGAR